MQRYQSDRHAEIERTTKNRKEIRAVVSSQLQTIIDKWGNKPLPDNYIFPYMKGHETAIERKAIVRDVVKRINKRMKLIGEELGIGNITTYRKTLYILYIVEY